MINIAIKFRSKEYQEFCNMKMGEVRYKDSYHNSTASGWTGTHRTSKSNDDNNYHSSILTVHYTLFEKGKENNTASVKISVNQSGKYSVSGNYASYNVN